MQIYLEHITYSPRSSIPNDHQKVTNFNAPKFTLYGTNTHMLHIDTTYFRNLKKFWNFWGTHVSGTFWRTSYVCSYYVGHINGRWQ